MNIPRPEGPVGFLIWVIGILAFTCVARIGWEYGGLLFHVLH